MNLLNWLLKFFNLQVVSLDLQVIPKEYIIIPHKKLYSDIVLQVMKHFNGLKADGEWKAHQVYATLIKRYPEIPKCDLRLEMELIYQQHFKNHV
jgi:hypothetical protein